MKYLNMRTEKEIKKFLVKCNSVRGFGMSIKNCPAEKGRKKGCCAECSAPSTLAWVLGGDGKPSANGQEILSEIVIL